MQRLIFMMIICIILAACTHSGESTARVSAAIETVPAPTYTPYPTYTPFPTQTPYPTHTLYPTPTPLPATSTPTLVATSTATTKTVAAIYTDAPTQRPMNTATLAHPYTPAATSTDLPAYDVRIVYIFFDGEGGRTEPDEYCEIRNVSEVVVDLEGWRLNAGAPGQDFRFPSYDLSPDEAIRVYTNELHAEYGGFSFAHTETALWANKGDCGHLYDASGEEVSQYCY